MLRKCHGLFSVIRVLVLGRDVFVKLAIQLNKQEMPAGIASIEMIVCFVRLRKFENP